jgi:hypothetical protein
MSCNDVTSLHSPEIRTSLKIGLFYRQKRPSVQAKETY